MSSRGSSSGGGLAWLVVFALFAFFGTGWFVKAVHWVAAVRDGDATVTLPTLPDMPDFPTGPFATTLPPVTTVPAPTPVTTAVPVTAAVPVTTAAPAPVTTLPVAVTTVAPVGGYATAPTWDHPFPAPTAADYQEAYARLETMTITPAGSTSTYDRAGWMLGWDPVAGVPAGSPARQSGCDVRQTLFLLWAQPGTAAKDSTCRATAGVYYDGYTGTSYTIPTDRKVAKVDVEHLVAVHEAHLSGGSAWDPVARNAFAMDYTIRSYHDGGTQLLLTDANENQHVKSDKDLGGYLPADPGSRCGFVVDVIAVKARYGLSMDAEEVSAAVDYLDVCAAGGSPDRP